MMSCHYGKEIDCDKSTFSHAYRSTSGPALRKDEPLDETPSTDRTCSRLLYGSAGRYYCECLATSYQSQPGWRPGWLAMGNKCLHPGLRQFAAHCGNVGRSIWGEAHLSQRTGCVSGSLSLLGLRAISGGVDWFACTAGRWCCGYRIDHAGNHLARVQRTSR